MLPSCSMRGRFSGKQSFSGQSESWPDRGAPERPTRLLAEGGAPGGAAPSVNGRARSHCAARGGSVNPASKGASQALWRLPPLHRPRKDARVTAKPRTQLRRENVGPWLFEIVDRKSGTGAATHSASCAGLTRASIDLRKSLPKVMDCRVKPGNE